MKDSVMFFKESLVEYYFEKDFFFFFIYANIIYHSCKSGRNGRQWPQHPNTKLQVSLYEMLVCLL